MCRSWDEEYSVLPVSGYEDDLACCRCRCHGKTDKIDQYTQVDSDFLDSEIGNLCETVLTEPSESRNKKTDNQGTKSSAAIQRIETLLSNIESEQKAYTNQLKGKRKASKVFQSGQSRSKRKIEPQALAKPTIKTSKTITSAVNSKRKEPEPSTSEEDSPWEVGDENDMDPDYSEPEVTKKSSFVCDQCGKSFVTKKGLKNHQKLHLGDRPFKCAECGAGFTTKAILNTHENTHTGIKPHKCELCDLAFSNSGNLVRHRRIHSGEKPFQCATCGHRCVSKTSLAIHEKKHSDDRPYSCDQCDQKFKLNHHLKQHTMIHTGEKPFLCNICGMKTKRLAQHMFHLKTHDESYNEMKALAQSAFKCEICGISYKYQSQLNDHQLDIHQGVTSILKCPECPRTFYVRSVYNKHLASHSSKKFQCEVCGLQAQSMAALKLHMMNHTGEKPFKCNYCDYSARLKSSVEQHERIHTGEKPFKCETCEKSFRIKNHLKEHILTHIDARPYKCEQCDATFRRPAALHFHRQTHTKERPYPCDLCSASFRLKRDLKKHILTHNTSFETFAQNIDYQNIGHPSTLGLVENNDQSVILQIDYCG